MAGYIKAFWKGEGSGVSRRSRKGGEYSYYAPDTLTDRKFSLDGDTAADISDAERAITELNNSAKALSNTEALARLMLRAEAISSSRIEGLVMDARRILKAELDADSRDVTALEILNNINAMDLALGQALAGEVTLDTIKNIHTKLMRGTRLEKYAGIIRTEQNWLGGNAYNPIGATYVPPKSDLVVPLMEDLVRFINTDGLPPLAQAAVAHAQFENIHPFADGNGRCGRTLIHLILRRRSIASNVVPPISLVLATLAQDYVRELETFRHSGESDSEQANDGLNSWVSFFAGCTLRACLDASNFENRVDNLKQEWVEKLKAMGTVSSNTRLVLDTIVGQPVFAAKSIELASRLTLPTVNSAIARLVNAGVVKQINAGKRNRVFEAVGVLGIFTDFERSLATPTSNTATAKPNRPAPFATTSTQA
jgi:Fic family protein